jgi:hypothetical protein
MGSIWAVGRGTRRRTLGRHTMRRSLCRWVGTSHDRVGSLYDADDGASSLLRRSL